MAERSEVEILLRAIDQVTAPFRTAGRATGDLTKALAEADGQARQVGPGAEAAGQAFQRMGGHAGQAAAAVQTLVSALGVRAAVQGMVGAVTGAVRTFSDFQLGLTEAGAVAGATAQEIAILRERALSLGESTKFSAKEVTSAFYEMSSAGLSVTQQLAGIEGVLDFAAAGNIAIGEAAGAATVGLKAFRLEATETTRVVDVFTKAVTASSFKAGEFQQAIASGGGVAAQAGQSLESFIAAAAQLRNIGAAASDAGTSIKAALMQGVINPSVEAQKKYGYLIEQFRDGTGKVKQWADIVAVVERETGKMGDAQRDAAIATIFGADGIRAMTASLAAGSEKVRQFTEDLQKAEGTAKSIAGVMMQQLDGSLKELAGSLETFRIKVGTDLEEPARGVLGAITELIRGFNGLDDATRQSVLILGGGVGLTAVAVLATAAVLGLSAALGGVLAGAGAILGPIAAVGAVVTVLAAGLYRLQAQAKETGQVFGMTVDENVAAAHRLKGAAAEVAASLKAMGEAGEQGRKKIIETDDAVRKVQALQKEYEGLRGETTLTAEQKERLRTVVGELNTLIPSLNLKLDGENRALSEVRGELRAYIELKGQEIRAEREAVASKARLAADELGILYVLARERERVAREALQKAQETVAAGDRAIAKGGDKVPGNYFQAKEAVAGLTSELGAAGAEAQRLQGEIARTGEEVRRLQNLPEPEFLKWLRGEKTPTQSPTKAVDDGLDHTLTKVQGAFGLLEQWQVDTLKALDDAKGKALRMTGDILEAQRGLFDAGALDPAAFIGVLTEMMTEELTVADATSERYKAIYAARQKAIQDTIRLNLDLAESERISPEEAGRRNQALVALLEATGDRRVLLEKGVQDAIGQLQDKAFADFVKREQRRVDSGALSQAGMLELIDAEIRKREAAGDTDRKVLDEMREVRRRFAEQVRGDQDAQVRWETETHQRTLESYRDYLAQRLDDTRAGTEEYRRIFSDWQAASREVDIATPIRRQAAEVERLQTTLEVAKKEFQELYRAASPSEQKAAAEAQFETIRRTTEATRAHFELLLQKAKLETDPERRAALEQDALRARGALVDALSEYRRFAAEVEGRAGTGFLRQFQWDEESIRDLLQTLDAEMRVKVTLPTGEVVERAETAVERAHRLMEEAGQTGAGITDTLRRMEESNRADRADAATKMETVGRQIADHASAVQEAARQTARMADRVLQTIVVNIGKLELGRELEDAVRRQLSAVLA
jgi:TP901 family phage tail tape measure protein